MQIMNIRIYPTVYGTLRGFAHLEQLHRRSYKEEPRATASNDPLWPLLTGEWESSPVHINDAIWA